MSSVEQLTCRASDRGEGGAARRCRPSLSRALRVVLVAVWISVCLAPPAVAQAPPEALLEDDDAANAPLEEIIVREKKSLRTLRLDVQEARERIYELFNAYNIDDDLDIHCSYERRVGSRFKERVCRGRYIDDATHRAGSEVARSLQSSCPLGLTSPPCDAEAAFSNATSIFQEEYKLIPYMNVRLDRAMRRLARENPEVAAAIAEYGAKEREYRDAAARRYPNR